MERSITPAGRAPTSLPIEMQRKVEAFAAKTKLNCSEAIEALIALGLEAHNALRSSREPALPLQSFA
jgi:hypothetical protein